MGWFQFVEIECLLCVDCGYLFDVCDYFEWMNCVECVGQYVVVDFVDCVIDVCIVVEGMCGCDEICFVIIDYCFCVVCVYQCGFCG